VSNVSQQLTPAVFLDRDGTLMEEVDYCRDPALVRLIPGVREGLAALKAAGFRCVIVTNQSGIGRGRITEPEYHAVHARLMELIGPGLIDATYYCPDVPNIPSECRKPAPGMILQAAKDHPLDLTRSWMIGDKESDIRCGRNAGTKTVLVATGYGATQGDTGADFTVSAFPDAVSIILR
jgi:D-glycero-D-manno-heptose 1,7-bisphosphate phosphatase